MAEKGSAFDTPWFNSQDKSFFNSLNKTKIPHVILTAETEDFADEVTQQWITEGFHTQYVALLNGGSDYIKRVHAVGESFGPSEQYAIVAFGDAATLILQSHTKPNNPKLCAIVAYYPSAIPDPHKTHYPPSVQVLVHLAGTEIDVHRNPEVLGIQGKTKTVRKRVGGGAGLSGTINLSFKTYAYQGCESGFAEHDLDEFNAVAESLAFGRSLQTVRKGFRLEAADGIEAVRDRLVDSTASRDVKTSVKSLHEFAHVVNGPVLTGGVGAQQLQRFYAEFFAPLPPTYTVQLLSRTVGTDRVVDEMFVNFTHSQPIQWMLPGIPATNRRVEVIVVSIVCVRGGKLESEHVYWDQASVLVQVGLLDPKLAVPEAMKGKGVNALPVQGAEAARAVKRGSSKMLNKNMPGW